MYYLYKWDLGLKTRKSAVFGGQKDRLNNRAKVLHFCLNKESCGRLHCQLEIFFHLKPYSYKASGKIYRGRYADEAGHYPSARRDEYRSGSRRDRDRSPRDRWRDGWRGRRARY